MGAEILQLHRHVVVPVKYEYRYCYDNACVARTNILGAASEWGIPAVSEGAWGVTYYTHPR